MCEVSCKNQRASASLYILKEGLSEALGQQITPQWEGDVPLTLVIKNGKTVAIQAYAFRSLDEITKMIDPFLR